MTILDVPRWENKLNDGLGMNEPRRISNSEVSSYLQCERKWYYGYSMNIEPIQTGQALSRGIIGHECLAAYYQTLMEGHSKTKAEQACRARLYDFAEDVEMFNHLRALLDRYMAMARADDWEIIAVEQSYDIDVNESFGYVMRLDLLAKIGGKLVLVDHKFIGQHYSQDVVDMNAQMPKYIGALEFNGVKVDYAMLNQLLTKTRVKIPYTDEELFVRTCIRPNRAEIKNVLQEQFKASRQIMQLRNADDAEPMVLRTMNQMTCKNCSFAKLCKSQLMGETGDLTPYRPNTYGYNAVGI